MIREKVRVKSTKGITLIALVITIIVLLILAGITINLTIGEHGILNMAKEAGKNYQNSAEYEQGAIANFFNEAQNIINGGNGSESRKFTKRINYHR